MILSLAGTAAKEMINMDKDILILAIESSCDETAAAVVKMDGKYFLMLFPHKLSCISFMAALCRKLHRVSILRRLTRLLKRL